MRQASGLCKNVSKCPKRETNEANKSVGVEESQRASASFFGFRVHAVRKVRLGDVNSLFGVWIFPETLFIRVRHSSSGLSQNENHENSSHSAGELIPLRRGVDFKDFVPRHR